MGILENGQKKEECEGKKALELKLEDLNHLIMSEKRRSL